LKQSRRRDGGMVERQMNSDLRKANEHMLRRQRRMADYRQRTKHVRELVWLRVLVRSGVVR
jgi:hypothetical protein